MATHFQIKRGLSTELFDIQGNCRLKTKVEGCWYLTLDTAEVYVCVRSNPGDASSELVLRRINELGDFSDYYKKDEIDSFLTTLTEELEEIRSNINIIEADVESNKNAVTRIEEAIQVIQPIIEKNAEGIATIVESIEVIDGQLVTVNTKLNEHTAAIETLTQTVEKLETTNTETLATITAEISTLKETTETLAEVVMTKANAADVYTKTEVYTKEEAHAEFMTQAEVVSEVDNRINALIAASDPDGDGNVIKNIQTLVEYVENNAGDIASIIKTNTANTEKLVAVESKLDNVESQLTDIESDISTIEGKLVGVETTVTDYVETYIAENVIQPKASDEITIAEDGTLGIGEVSTDKLVQGEQELILDGGAAPATKIDGTEQ